MDSLLISRLQSLPAHGLLTTLCLASAQHALLITPAGLADEIGHSLSALCDGDLHLSHAVVDCAHISLDSFREALLVEDPDSDSGSDSGLDTRRVADVVVALRLERAHEAVQVQALELMQSGRVYTRSALHLTGRRFVLLGVVEGWEGRLRLNPHLRDRFAVGHWHDDIEDDGMSVESGSIRSVLLGKGCRESYHGGLGQGWVEDLRKAVEKVTLTAEVSAYSQNLVVAMRLHRLVATGVSAQATRHLKMVAKAMAVLHGQDYVTPAIVTLAARKVYLHRLVLADEHTERSLRWGGDPAAVRYQMQDMDVETAIEEVIASVPSPL